MCLFITIAILATGYNFYTHELFSQAYMSFGFALIPFVFLSTDLLKTVNVSLATNKTVIKKIRIDRYLDPLCYCNLVLF